MAAVGPAPSTDAAQGEQRSGPGRVAAHCEESAWRRAASTDARFLAPGSGLGGSQEEQESRGAHGAISSGQSPSTPALRDETHLCGRLGPGVSKADCRRCALKKWRGHFSITGESLAVTGTLSLSASVSRTTARTETGLSPPPSSCAARLFDPEEGLLLAFCQSQAGELNQTL